MYYNNDSFLDKLERKLGKFSFKYLTMVLLVGMAVVGVLDYALVRAGYFPLSSLLSFNKWLILRGEVWRVITFVFVPEVDHPLLLLFYLYFFYFMGTALSREWGFFKFNAYYLIGYLGTLGFGFITGYATTYYLNLTLFLAFAILNPNMKVLLLYIIPIKVKWLAILDCAIILIDLVIYPWPFKIAILISLFNVVLFFWKSVVYGIKSFFRRQRYKSQFNDDNDYEKEQKRAIKKARKVKIRVVKDDEFYPNKDNENKNSGKDNPDDLFGF